MHAGMDELFVDVTALVQGHLVKLQMEQPEQDTLVFFSLDPNMSKGFHYKYGTVVGLTHPSISDQPTTTVTPEHAAASHLVAHIRQQIHVQAGLTSSGELAMMCIGCTADRRSRCRRSG